MKIRLLESISSECGRFLQTKGSELTVTDTDEQRGVYEATLNDGFFVVPFQCAEGIVEPLPVDQDYKGGSIQQTLAGQRGKLRADYCRSGRTITGIQKHCPIVLKEVWEQLPALT